MARHTAPSDKAIRGPQQHWICPRCGHANNPRFVACTNCNLRRPPRPPSPPVEVEA